MKNQMLVAEWLATPWALQREALAAYVAIIARNQFPEGSRAMEDDDDFTPRKSAWEMRREQAARLSGGGVMVLPLYGVIVQRSGIMTELCGGTSTQQFSAALREAVADASVGAIVIDIDSPGGSVYGVQELGEEIYQARDKKPVIGIANSLAASAAYWLGAACSELYVTPGGEAGSIGVWGAHEDWSKYLEEIGVKTTLISAGKFKTEGNPYEPLSKEALGFMQSRIDDYYGAFTKAVARGRGVGVAQVRDGMGQGRVLGGDAAVTQQMVDGVATFDEVIKKAQRSLRAPAAKTASRRARAENELKILG
jgi:signal peptide peptidase SppA